MVEAPPTPHSTGCIIILGRVGIWAEGVAEGAVSIMLGNQLTLGLHSGLAGRTKLWAVLQTENAWPIRIFNRACIYRRL